MDKTSSPDAGASPIPAVTLKAAAKRAVVGILTRVGLDAPARQAWRRLRDRRHRPRTGPYPSETSKCRARLAPYCLGYGLDLGFGGDPITPAAIRMDRPSPYAYTGDHPVQLGGKAEDLYWFRDGVLDFVYSSHLLEDYVDTEAVLREWLRVLRPGGRLIIFCPDEQIFRKHCATTGQPYNPHHVHADFSLEKVKGHLRHIGGTRILHETPLVDIYSWELVCEKTV
jgi:predicted SAM-dependent methyltransferase